MKNTGFKPTICNHCTQTMDYLLGLDKGSVQIVLDILRATSAKGVNEIHPTREMDLSGKKKWFVTNLSRPRFHGLIAYVEDKKGYYCLTRKAGKFLRGESVPRYAIISKVTGHNEGYWDPEKYSVTLKEIILSDEYDYWEGDMARMIDLIDPREVEKNLTLFDLKTQTHSF